MMEGVDQSAHRLRVERLARDLIAQCGTRAVHVVMSISDRVVCMAEGRVIADGTPREVVANQALIDAYLGQRRGRALS